MTLVQSMEHVSLLIMDGWLIEKRKEWGSDVTKEDHRQAISKHDSISTNSLLVFPVYESETILGNVVKLWRFPLIFFNVSPQDFKLIFITSQSVVFSVETT